MPVLAAVSTGPIWVVYRKGSRVLLSMGGREPAPRVIAEVRAREGGSEVDVRLDGAASTNDGVLATVLASIWLSCGVVGTHPFLLLVGAGSLAALIRWRITAMRARGADFKAIAQAIDDALREFRPGEEGAVYRVGGREPAIEARGPADDGLGLFRRRARLRR